MFFGDSIQDTRQFFFNSWEKFKQKKTLEPLEKQLVAVMIDHPEYHDMLASPSLAAEANYFPELGQTNPFLHMGLHLAIREQVNTNRPIGITELFQSLVQQQQDPLKAEHIIMDALAECLWQAQRNQCAPDETAYLAAIRKLVLGA